MLGQQGPMRAQCGEPNDGGGHSQSQYSNISSEYIIIPGSCNLDYLVIRYKCFIFPNINSEWLVFLLYFDGGGGFRERINVQLSGDFLSTLQLLTH